jgi:hypothetical protein
MSATIMSREEKRALLIDGLKVSLMLADNDAEMRKLYGNRRLYVGSSPNRSKWHEARTSKNETLWCRCPNFAHVCRPGKEDTLCKHLMYATALDLDVPRTEDMV